MGLEEIKSGFVNNLNFGTSKSVNKPANSEEIKESLFSNFKKEKGTEVLTQNSQNVYGAQQVKTNSNEEIARKTNDMLKMAKIAYRVNSAQVAGIDDFMTTTTLPALNNAFDLAVKARIEDPKGPYADLFV